MHELSVAQSLLELVEEHVPLERRGDVRAVRVRLGALSGIVAESLSFCFEALVAETSLAAACLEFEHIPVRLSCAGCGQSFEIEGVAFRCPGCGGSGVRVVSGSELELREVELAESPVEVG